MHTTAIADILSNFANNFLKKIIPKILLSKLNKKSVPLLNVVTGALVLVIITMLVTSFAPLPNRHYTLSCVVIDAGHGGHDPGCLGSKAKEKDISLAVALKLGKYIENNFKDVKVIYTRKTDVFVELHERAAIANNARADLFICVHCNSAAAHDVFGPETWVMGLHRTQANLEVSKRENEVVLLEKDYLKKYDGFDPNSPEANIIFSLYQNAYLDQSLKMASLVQQELKTKGRPGRGVKQAGFLVLYKTAMPSILVECGFLTNNNEEKYMTSAKGQDEIAHSVFSAFKTYKNSVESFTSGNTQENDVQENESQENQVKENCCDETAKTIKPLGDDDPADTAGKNMKAAEPKKAIGEEATIPKNNLKKNKTQPKAKNDELVFSVQIVLSTSALSDESPKFKGVKKIALEKAGGLFKYRSGSFSSLEEAIRYQSEMRTKGFADAFVVAFKNGRRIPIKEAREMIQKK